MVKNLYDLACGRAQCRHIIRLFWSVSGLCAVASPLYASPYQQNINVSVGAEYDSNPDMVSNDERSVWRGLLKPEYQLKWKQDENEVLAKAGLNLEQSSDTELSDNREDPSVSLKWTGTNPRGALWTQGSYEEQATRVTELDDTGNLRPDGTRTRWAADVGWNRAVTQRTQVDISVGYEDVSYDVDSLVDFTSARLGLKSSYLLNELVSPYFQLGASRYEPDEVTELNDNSNLYGAFAGVVWKLNEFFESDLYAGATHVDDEVFGTETNWNGGVSLTYASEKLGAMLSYARETNPTGSGSGGFEEADVAAASLTYEYSELTRLGGSAGYRKNRTSLNNDTAQAELWADHDLAESWTIRASWRFRQEDGNSSVVDQRVDDQGKAEANIVLLSLRYTMPEET